MAFKDKFGTTLCIGDTVAYAIRVKNPNNERASLLDNPDVIVFVTSRRAP